MKKTLEKLWNEYLMDECAEIEGDEERACRKKTAEMHKAAHALLDETQQKVMEEYVESLLALEQLFVKKAFFKGCEFAVSFLLEARNSNK